MAIETPPQFEEKDLPKYLEFLVNHNNEIEPMNLTYPYWTKVKAVAKAKDLNPNLYWNALKLRRATNWIRVYLHEQFLINIPPQTQRLLHELDMHCGGSLQSLVDLPINERQKKTFIISSLRTEAYNSSVLEGAVATKERAKEIINSKKSPRTEGEKMIYNNYRAMEFIIENKNEPLTEDALYLLHEILTSGTLESEKSGRFRSASEDIKVVDLLKGEEIYTPPPASQIKERIAQLIQFFNYKESLGLANRDSKQNFIHPIVRATIVHFMIGYIHPFYDGNGRIARALFYWHMLANGYWLVEYLSISQVILKSRAQYYRAFQYVESDQNDLTYFIQYHTRAVGIAFEDLLKYLDRKLTKQKHETVDLAAQFKVSARQAEILVLLRDSPTVWTTQQVQARLQISPNTARTDLNILTQRGLLQRISLDKKTQGWRLA